MASLYESISVFISPENDEGLQSSAFENVNQMLASTNKIQDVIINIEKYLTSTEDRERYRATLLVAEILHTNSAMSLNSSVIHLLVVFFDQRLSDYPTIVPSLHALTALVRFHSFDFDEKYMDYVDIFETVFKQINVQNYAQTIRQKVYELLYEILRQSNVKSTCSSISIDILDGILTSFEGEKDPRCLLIALKLISHAVTVFSNELESSETTEVFFERLFDSISPYFPITFQSPPDDPYGLKPEQLVTALQDCICCHSSLLIHALPFLNDQLFSEIPVGRSHAMISLIELCNKYSVSILTKTLGHISSQAVIRKLTEGVYDNATDSGSESHEDGVVVSLSVKAHALLCIHEISSLIGDDAAKYILEFELFCNAIISKAFETLRVNNLDSFKTKDAVDILCMICSSSVIHAYKVLDKVLPILTPTTTADRKQSLHTYAKSEIQHVAILNDLIKSVGFNFFKSYHYSHDHQNSHSSSSSSRSLLEIILRDNIKLRKEKDSIISADIPLFVGCKLCLFNLLNDSKHCVNSGVDTIGKYAIPSILFSSLSPLRELDPVTSVAQLICSNLFDIIDWVIVYIEKNVVDLELAVFIGSCFELLANILIRVDPSFISATRLNTCVSTASVLSCYNGFKSNSNQESGLDKIAEARQNKWNDMICNVALKFLSSLTLISSVVYYEVIEKCAVNKLMKFSGLLSAGSTFNSEPILKIKALKHLSHLCALLNTSQENFHDAGGGNIRETIILHFVTNTFKSVELDERHVDVMYEKEIIDCYSTIFSQQDNRSDYCVDDELQDHIVVKKRDNAKLFAGIEIDIDNDTIKDVVNSICASSHQGLVKNSILLLLVDPLFNSASFRNNTLMSVNRRRNWLKSTCHLIKETMHALDVKSQNQLINSLLNIVAYYIAQNEGANNHSSSSRGSQFSSVWLNEIIINVLLSSVMYLDKTSDFFCPTNSSTDEMMNIDSNNFHTINQVFDMVFIVLRQNITVLNNFNISLRIDDNDDDIFYTAAQLLFVLLNKSTSSANYFDRVMIQFLSVNISTMIQLMSSDIATLKPVSIEKVVHLFLSLSKSILIRPKMKIHSEKTILASYANDCVYLQNTILNMIRTPLVWSDITMKVLLILITSAIDIDSNQHTSADKSIIARYISEIVGYKISMLLLVQDDEEDAWIGSCNISTMYKQKLWTDIWLPLFSTSQDKTSLYSKASLMAINALSIANMTSFSESIDEVVMVAMQSLIISCDSLFDGKLIKQTNDDVAMVVAGIDNNVEQSVLVVDANLQLGTSSQAYISASQLKKSSNSNNTSNSDDDKKSVYVELDHRHDLILCKESLVSLNQFMEQPEYSHLSSVEHILSPHINTLVPKLLLVAKYHPEQTARHLSLNCLLHLAKFPYHLLYPVKSRVLKELAVVLDDKKKKIRLFASKVRNEWYLLS